MADTDETRPQHEDEDDLLGELDAELEELNFDAPGPHGDAEAEEQPDALGEPLADLGEHEPKTGGQDLSFVDEELPDPVGQGKPIEKLPRDSLDAKKRSILDKALSGSSLEFPRQPPRATPPDGAEPEPEEGNEADSSPPEVPAGNRPLAGRPRRRLPQRKAPALDEDEIVFEEDEIVFEEEVAVPAVIESTDVPAADEAPDELADLPDLDVEAEVEPTTTIPDEDPEPDPVELPETDPIDIDAPDLEEDLPELPTLDESLGDDLDPLPSLPDDEEFPVEEEPPDPIDSEFDDLPELPDLDSIEALSPADEVLIDPTPQPDYEALVAEDVSEEDLPDDETTPAIASDGAEYEGDDDLIDDPLPEETDHIDPIRGNGVLAATKEWFAGLKPLELASLIVIALSCLAGIFMFSAWSKKGTPQRPLLPQPQATTPGSISGSHVTISSIDSYWESSATDDPEADQQFLPVLELTVEPSSTGTILAVFKDDQGGIIDSVSERVEGGRFVSTGEATGRLVCPSGLENEFLLATYLGDDDWNWTVNLRESKDNREFADLAFFNFTGDRR